VSRASACALPACGGADRSPQAYCRAFYTHAAPIRQSYVNAASETNTNPLAALVKLVAAPGDLASIFDSMVPHAPDAIKSDTVEVRDSFKHLQDSLGKSLTNPLAALAGNLGTALTSAGAFNRVGSYLDTNCPVNSPLAQGIINPGN